MSNVPPKRDHGTARAGHLISYRRARQSEIYPALRLILGADGPASDQQVVDFLRMAIYRKIDLNNLWVAERKEQILWAALCVVSPDATMVMVAPSRLNPDCDEPARTLVCETLRHFRSRGVRFAQVLLEADEAPLVSFYECEGFERLADLVYLGREVGRIEQEELPLQLSWIPYTREKHGLFAQTLARTYQDSLDCPKLNGRRSIEEIIAGHKAIGPFDPKLWFLLMKQSEPVGACLLSRSAHTQAMELVYLGLVPEARRRGFGDVLMRKALLATRLANCTELTLAVDSRNTPALQLYKRHGMKPVCTKIALIRELAKPTATILAPAKATRPRRLLQRDIDEDHASSL